jgi:hypothetical protein
MMKEKSWVIIGVERAGLDEHPHRAWMWHHPGLRWERDDGKHGTRRPHGPLKFFLEGARRFAGATRRVDRRLCEG